VTDEAQPNNLQTAIHGDGIIYCSSSLDTNSVKNHDVVTHDVSIDSLSPSDTGRLGITPIYMIHEGQFNLQTTISNYNASENNSLNDKDDEKGGKSLSKLMLESNLFAPKNALDPFYEFISWDTISSSKSMAQDSLGFEGSMTSQQQSSTLDSHAIIVPEEIRAKEKETDCNDNNKDSNLQEKDRIAKCAISDQVCATPHNRSQHVTCADSTATNESNSTNQSAQQLSSTGLKNSKLKMAKFKRRRDRLLRITSSIDGDSASSSMDKDHTELDEAASQLQRQNNIDEAVSLNSDTLPDSSIDNAGNRNTDATWSNITHSPCPCLDDGVQSTEKVQNNMTNLAGLKRAKFKRRRDRLRITPSVDSATASSSIDQDHIIELEKPASQLQEQNNIDEACGPSSEMPNNSIDDVNSRNDIDATWSNIPHPPGSCLDDSVENAENPQDSAVNLAENNNGDEGKHQQVVGWNSSKLKHAKNKRRRDRMRTAVSP